MSVALGYSTSIGMGCGLFDALETRFGLAEDSQNKYVNGAKAVARRALATSAVYAAPAFLPLVSSRFSPLTYLTFQTRTLLSSRYNGVNAIGHGVAAAYHAIKGDYGEFRNSTKTALKFGWRAGLDLALYSSCPVNLMYPAIAEGALNALMPVQLRNGINRITRFIDDKIIGKPEGEQAQRDEDQRQQAIVPALQGVRVDAVPLLRPSHDRSVAAGEPDLDVDMPGGDEVDDIGERGIRYQDLREDQYLDRRGVTQTTREIAGRYLQPLFGFTESGSGGLFSRVVSSGGQRSYRQHRTAVALHGYRDEMAELIGGMSNLSISSSSGEGEASDGGLSSSEEE